MPKQTELPSFEGYSLWVIIPLCKKDKLQRDKHYNSDTCSLPSSVLAVSTRPISLFMTTRMFLMLNSFHVTPSFILLKSAWESRPTQIRFHLEVKANHTP